MLRGCVWLFFKDHRVNRVWQELEPTPRSRGKMGPKNHTSLCLQPLTPRGSSPWLILPDIQGDRETKDESSWRTGCLSSPAEYGISFLFLELSLISLPCLLPLPKLHKAQFLIEFSLRTKPHEQCSHCFYSSYHCFSRSH